MCDLFFFNDTATTEIYTLSLHDALPIYLAPLEYGEVSGIAGTSVEDKFGYDITRWLVRAHAPRVSINWDLHEEDRKSTRLNSSHANISYAVFCLKKKNISLNPFLHLLAS